MPIPWVRIVPVVPLPLWLHVVPEEHNLGRVPPHRIVDRREPRVVADAEDVRTEIQSPFGPRRPALDVWVAFLPRLHPDLLALKPRESVSAVPPVVIRREADLCPRCEVDGVVDGDGEIRAA